MVQNIKSYSVFRIPLPTFLLCILIGLIGVSYAFYHFYKNTRLESSTWYLQKIIDKKGNQHPNLKGYFPQKNPTNIKLDTLHCYGDSADNIMVELEELSTQKKLIMFSDRKYLISFHNVSNEFFRKCFRLHKNTLVLEPLPKNTNRILRFYGLNI